MSSTAFLVILIILVSQLTKSLLLQITEIYRSSCTQTSCKSLTIVHMIHLGVDNHGKPAYGMQPDHISFLLVISLYRKGHFCIEGLEEFKFLIISSIPSL